MRKYNRFLMPISFYLVVLHLYGCKDIIQQDISSRVVEVLSPADSVVSDKYDVTFWWDEVQDAKKYRLQIVTPSFSAVQQFIADSLISDTKFTLQLFPGNYQWRIRAENGTSYTPFVTRVLKIDTNSNLTNQTFNVNSPVTDYYTSSMVSNFSWPAFPYATTYEYVITNTVTGIQKILTTDQANITDTITEGNYFWKVRALNSNNNTMTLYSQERTIFVDLTAPAASLPYLPADNGLDTNSVRLVWLRSTDAYADSIWVAQDSLFQNIVQKTYTTDTSYLLQPLIFSNTYYWKLKTRDKAGNWSNNSVKFKFTVTL